MKLKRAIFPTLLALAAAIPLTAAAQAYPSKPVKIVVPFAPAGAVDAVARIMQPKLAELLGQPVVIDNKPGANADIGAQAVLASPADGYTTLLSANPLATNPTLNPKLPYNPLKDFAMVARVGYAPLVLVVPADSPAKSVKDLVAESKAKPNTMNYGSAAAGGSGHLASELLKIRTGMDAQHIAYKGGAPALTDLIAGRLTFMLINPLEAAPHVKAGKLRALAVSSPKRIAQLPDVPTFDEAGVKDFRASVWWGYLVPAATPKEVVARLSHDILKTLEDPVVREKLVAVGAEVEPQDAAAFGAFLKSETETWAGVIKAAHIKAD
jgi:tripartite-type tricarboxylate transporter receptor subunit TctC